MKHLRNPRTVLCPKCGRELLEDVTENLSLNVNGTYTSFICDQCRVWICGSCGGWGDDSGDHNHPHVAMETPREWVLEIIEMHRQLKERISHAPMN